MIKSKMMYSVDIFSWYHRGGLGHPPGLSGHDCVCDKTGIGAVAGKGLASNHLDLGWLAEHGPVGDLDVQRVEHDAVEEATDKEPGGWGVGAVGGREGWAGPRKAAERPPATS